MNPAWSVIFLTTLLGVGQGLFLALYTAQLYALFGLLPAHRDSGFHALGAAVALTFLVAGLAASFLHLGHPERAWRAASQWRSSWLSREVIVLPLFMAAVALYGLAHGLGWTGTLFVLPGAYAVDATLIVGGIGTLLAFGLFVATAMIYACLRFLQEWHTPLTVLNYILLGGASGFTLAGALAAVLAPELASFLAGWAAVITGLAFVSRVASLLRNARIKPKSALQTAIGVKHPRIVQKSQGFTAGSFNTREFFHRRGPGRLRGVKWAFLLLVFVLPPLLLGGGLASLSAVLSFAGFLSQYAGLLAERWFFFAQANHPQNLYYQAVS
jgi:DMSO reductase anchor subunit